MSGKIMRKSRGKPAKSDKNIAKGIKAINAGQWQEAEKIFRDVLEREPHNHMALMLLGAALSKCGRHEEALAFLAEAAKIAPEAAYIQSNLGMALHAAGRRAEAIAAYQKAITIDPNLLAAHYNLGILCAEIGDWHAAISHFEYTVGKDPEYLDVWKRLAETQGQRGAYAEAIACYRQYVKRKANDPEAWLALARYLLVINEREAAISCLKKAVASAPGNADMLFKAARELLNREIGDATLEFLEQALALKPGDPYLIEAKAVALAYTGNFTEAVVWAEKALALMPSLVQARNLRGFIRYKMGDVSGAFADFSAAVQLQPEAEFIGSNKLLMMNYLEIDQQEVAKEHRKWGDFFIDRYRPYRPKLTNDLDPERKLRIGYLSPDFRQHSVAFFIGPLLAAHDRQVFEIYCYANVKNPDKFTERIRSFPLTWRDITILDDKATAYLINEDRINILVDLAGHTSHNRLPVFALRPAPVQMTYLGYPATTGLDTIHYRLTDSLADPPGMTDHLYTERLIRLSPCFLCYNPLRDAPEVAPLPADERGSITFGSFSNAAKISDGCVAMWAEVLRAVPGSTLILKYDCFNTEETRAQMQRRFADQGIDPQRVRLSGHTPDIKQHLATYREVDIALDTWPYHGTTTTCEALWMGVPVVTLAGKSHASRVGVSILTTVNLPELIAQTPEEYVRIAAALASDRQRLAQLRQNMRERLWRSPLLDMKTFTRQIEDVYRSCWRNYCANSASLA